MIEQKENYQIQTPDVADNYLYKEMPNGSRIFATKARIPNGFPLWLECTATEKEAFEIQWKIDHPEEYPEEPEEPTDEYVDETNI